MTNEAADVYGNFSYKCQECPATVRVIESTIQPHICHGEVK